MWAYVAPRYAKATQRNSVLRQQLDEALSANKQLMEDLTQKVRYEKKMKEELEDKEADWKAERQVCMFTVMTELIL